MEKRFEIGLPDEEQVPTPPTAPTVDRVAAKAIALDKAGRAHEAGEVLGGRANATERDEETTLAARVAAMSMEELIANQFNVTYDERSRRENAAILAELKNRQAAGKSDQDKPVGARGRDRIEINF